MIDSLWPLSSSYFMRPVVGVDGPAGSSTRLPPARTFRESDGRGYWTQGQRCRITDALEAFQAAALQRRFPFSPDERPPPRKRRCAFLEGFSLHAIRSELATASEVYTDVASAVSFANRYHELTLDPAVGLANLQDRLAGRTFFGCYISYANDPWSGNNMAFFVDAASGFRVLTETRWSESSGARAEAIQRPTPKCSKVRLG